MPMHLKHLTGQRFGKLVVLRHDRTEREAYWTAVCDCGGSITERGSRLRNGSTIDCGCGKFERASLALRRHGMWETRTWNIWSGLRQRTCDPNNKDWNNYGGRGIKCCERWLHSFEAFLEDMGECPSTKHSIERVDHNGNYDPSNCVWATMKQQNRNRRNNRIVLYRGTSMPLAQACEEAGAGVDWHKARNRIERHGWAVDRAVEQGSNGRRTSG